MANNMVPVIDINSKHGDVVVVVGRVVEVLVSIVLYTTFDTIHVIGPRGHRDHGPLWYVRQVMARGGVQRR